MNAVGQLLLIALIGEPSGSSEVDRFLPCTPGLSITYEVVEGKKKVRTVVETVRGAGKEPRTCVIDRKTTEADGRATEDAYAREHLPDRITNAGPLDQPLAFRAALLKAPLAAGKVWRFNTTEFQVKEAGAAVEVPAGRFEGCVRVSERAMDGPYRAENVYAPDVGLIRWEQGERAMVAVKIGRPGAPAETRKKR